MMFGKRFRLEPRTAAPAGARLYAIGDIHGRADLLDDLLARIEADRNGAPARLIFLGDYVDRGPHARAVIDRLCALQGADHVFLRGNHEAAMLNFIEAPETGAHWLRIGGDATLVSYGVAPPPRDASPAALQEAAAALRAALPPAHVSFLNSLVLTAQFGDYVFVHAGLRPGRPLEEQTEEDMLEIRKPFLNGAGRWPFVVVHGHSPVERAHRDERRIAVDTGAYATGRLSAVRLDGDQVAFIATGD
jgi:serine/threonine protein phosphatase 1